MYQSCRNATDIFKFAIENRSKFQTIILWRNSICFNLQPVNFKAYDNNNKILRSI